MRIQAYRFGSMTIDGRTFANDLKIVNGNVVADWWRIEGHRLATADIEDVLTAAPEVLVVGTGEPGMMKVSDEVRARLAQLDIELIVRPTRQACDEFNRLLEEAAGIDKVAFAAHLTC